MSATTTTNPYVASLEAFMTACSTLCSSVIEHFRSNADQSLGVGEDSKRFYAELLCPALNGLDAAYKRELRRLYGVLTSNLEHHASLIQHILLTSPVPSSDVWLSQIAETHRRVAIQLAQRATSRYTDAVSAPPNPQKLFIGIHAFIARLITREISLSDLDSSIFWICLCGSSIEEAIEEELSPPALGLELAAKAMEMPGLRQQVIEKLSTAQKEGRLADTFLDGLKAMLTRNGVHSVSSDGFVYAFSHSEDKLGGSEWLAWVYGFEVI